MKTIPFHRGVESLSQSILENLEELLDYRVIFHQIIESCGSELNDSGNETAEGSKSNYKNDDRGRGCDKHDSGRSSDDSGKGNDGRGRGDDNHDIGRGGDNSGRGEWQKRHCSLFFGIF